MAAVPTCVICHLELTNGELNASYACGCTFHIHCEKGCADNAGEQCNEGSVKCPICRQTVLDCLEKEGQLEQASTETAAEGPSEADAKSPGPGAKSAGAGAKPAEGGSSEADAGAKSDQAGAKSGEAGPKSGEGCSSEDDANNDPKTADAGAKSADAAAKPAAADADDGAEPTPAKIARDAIGPYGFGKAKVSCTYCGSQVDAATARIKSKSAQTWKCSNCVNKMSAPSHHMTCVRH